MKIDINKANLIKENQHIIVGLSGGPDSVCLFYSLLDIAEEMNLTLYAVHVNHQLRPGAADEDEAYVKMISQKEGVECFARTIDCEKIAKEKSITCEEAGRGERYRAFSEAAEELVRRGIDRENIRIAVAHNKEDQAETILFRIIRGTGVDGLSGMSYERKDGFGNKIIRPLLDVSRKDIERFCEERGLNPRIDKTNSEAIYTRNKIRLELIPFLEEEFNTNIVDTITRLGKIASDDKKAIWHEAKEVYKQAAKDKLTLDIATLKKSEKAVVHRVYSLVLEKLGVTEDISMAHILAIDSLVYDEKQSPSAMAILPGEIKVSKLYDKLTFVQDFTEDSPENWQISILRKDEFDKKQLNDRQLGQSAAHSPYGAFDLLKAIEGRALIEDYAKLEEGTGLGRLQSRISIRKRGAGDYLKFKTGTKKLQDFLVDEKVPKMAREHLLFLAVDKEILWVLPSKSFEKRALREKGRFSGKYTVEEDTKWVLFVEKIV